MEQPVFAKRHALIEVYTPWDRPYVEDNEEDDVRAYVSIDRILEADYTVIREYKLFSTGEIPGWCQSFEDFKNEIEKSQASASFWLEQIEEIKKQTEQGMYGESQTDQKS
jgi:hypothetical protein